MICREEEEQWDEAEEQHEQHGGSDAQQAGPDASGDSPDDNQLPVNTLFYGVRGQQVNQRLVTTVSDCAFPNDNGLPLSALFLGCRVSRYIMATLVKSLLLYIADLLPM